ncbi:unnamed protein product [Sphenostylis stenocarpa]|uniref:Pentatricopeptide repeat-containing protein n=1 Tax=Sphenostylis stenocarpa TaxID=92480 RepID=A0AA86VE36_9FABA|nr:unnamed protein product [Sphenostylis stenocarpa]
MLRNGVLPDCYALPIVLKAVCQTFEVKLGKQVHSVVGEFGSARRVFDENPDSKLGSWNAVIGRLSQCGLARDAISVFLDMRRRGFEPDRLTMISVTSACGKIGDLNLALQLHKCVFQCGRMNLAYKVFATMEERTMSSWTSMIVAYGMHGHVNEALECFWHMRLLLLVRAYQVNGHMKAKLDPLNLETREIPKDLDPALYWLSRTQ